MTVPVRCTTIVGYPTIVGVTFGHRPACVNGRYLAVVYDGDWGGERLFFNFNGSAIFDEGQRCCIGRGADLPS